MPPKRSRKKSAAAVDHMTSLPRETLDRIASFTSFETAKALTLTARCFLEPGRKVLWSSFKLQTGYLHHGGTIDRNGKAHAQIALLAENPNLEQHIRRLILVIDRCGFLYDEHPQRIKDVLRILRRIAPRLEELVIQFRGSTHGALELEDLESDFVPERDLSYLYKPVGDFARQIYNGRTDQQKEDKRRQISYPMLHTLSLDIVGSKFHGGRSSDASPPDWTCDHTMKRVSPLPALPYLRDITLTSLDAASHGSGHLWRQCLRILDAAANVSSLIVSCRSSAYNGTFVEPHAVDKLVEGIWRSDQNKVDTISPFLGKIPRLGYQIDLTEDQELSLVDRLPALSSTKQLCIFTSARPSRARYVVADGCDTWDRTMPFNTAYVKRCPELCVIHLVDENEHFEQPMTHGYVCSSFDADIDDEDDDMMELRFLYGLDADDMCQASLSLGQPCYERYGAGVASRMDHSTPSPETWKADGFRGLLIRTYETGVAPPTDIATASNNGQQEAFTHVRFLSRAIPNGMAHPEGIKYATASVGRTAHERIRDRRTWVDMTDYCGQWVPRDILDLVYEAAGEPEGAGWMSGQRGGDLGPGWDVLRQWIRSTSAFDRAWSAEAVVVRDKNGKAKRRAPVPDMQYFQQTIHGNYPGHCKAHSAGKTYTAMKKQAYDEEFLF